MKKESKYNIIARKVDNAKLIYNSMSKAFVELEDKFNLKDLSNFTDDEIAYLYENAFIIDDDFDERALLKYMFNKSFYSDEFLNIVLVPGLECNFKCPYCFEKMEDKYERDISVKAYFDRLKLFALSTFENYKTIEISLFGGEPLLFIDKIYEFVMWAKKQFDYVEIFTSIVTNGSLLGHEQIEMLMNMECKSIQVTIDGYEEKHNTTRCYFNGKESYATIMNNINNCVNILPKDVTFNLRINLDNVEIEDVKRTLMDIKIENREQINVLFRPIYNTACYIKENRNKLKDLEAYYVLAKNLGYGIVKNSYLYQACESCSGENFFYIMPDLSIWKCINDLSYKEACIGLINENGDKNIDLRKLINWSKAANCFNEKKCSNCKLLPDCFGGCTLYKLKNSERSCKVFEMCSAPYLY